MIYTARNLITESALGRERKRKKERKGERRKEEMNAERFECNDI